MWVVKAKGCSSADAVLRWLNGEGIQVYGQRAAAEKVAARLGTSPPTPTLPEVAWEVVELPALLLQVHDELKAKLDLVGTVLQQMREIGVEALWPPAAEASGDPEPDTGDLTKN